jgi:hypothetical protein
MCNVLAILTTSVPLKSTPQLNASLVYMYQTSMSVTKIRQLDSDIVNRNKSIAILEVTSSRDHLRRNQPHLEAHH